MDTSGLTQVPYATIFNILLGIILTLFGIIYKNDKDTNNERLKKIDESIFRGETIEMTDKNGFTVKIDNLEERLNNLTQDFRLSDHSNEISIAALSASGKRTENRIEEIKDKLYEVKEENINLSHRIDLLEREIEYLDKSTHEQNKQKH